MKKLILQILLAMLATQITAQDQFTQTIRGTVVDAVTGYTLNYLLKPINKEKLRKSIEKLIKLQGKTNSIDIQAVIAAMDRERKQYKQRFSVNVGTKIKSIETANIAYFYLLDKNTFLCTKEKRHYPIDFALDKLEDLIDPQYFFRINRQYTVNYHAIEKINVLSRSRIAILTVPSTEEPLLVSTARTHEFRLWLDR